jgi:hypothetical protein
MDETGFSATNKSKKVMAEPFLTLFTMSRQERIFTAYDHIEG